MPGNGLAITFTDFDLLFEDIKDLEGVDFLSDMAWDEVLLETLDVNGTERIVPADVYPSTSPPLKVQLSI